MASTFDTKFDALLNKVPKSVMETPWRKALFWIISTAAILTGFLLVIVWEVFKAVILTDEDSPPVEDDRPDVNGYKPGDFFYSKPGTINPTLLELWDTDNNKDFL